MYPSPMLQVKHWWQEPSWAPRQAKGYPDLRGVRLRRRLRVAQAVRTKLELGPDPIYIYVGTSKALQ